MILKAVRRFGSPDLLDEVMPGVYRGDVRFAMGYTEPEGGSDIATCKARAVRDGKNGDEWVINGQKMFTSGAHNCRYIFLLTNTDPTGRRHHDLKTMRDIAPGLMDVLGSASALTPGAGGALSDAEHLYCWAPLVGIYGGTVDVFRNMIAQYMLGLGRPNYSPPSRKAPSQ